MTPFGFGKLALIVPDGLFLVLPAAAQPFLLKSFYILSDVCSHSPDAFQHHIPQHFLADVVGRTGAASAFVVGVNIAVLVALKTLAGAEVEFATAVSTERQSREQSLPLTLGNTPPVLTKFLHSVPLCLRDNRLLCIRQDEHILWSVRDSLFELVGLVVRIILFQHWEYMIFLMKLSLTSFRSSLS